MSPNKNLADSKTYSSFPDEVNTTSDRPTDADNRIVNNKRAVVNESSSEAIETTPKPTESLEPPTEKHSNPVKKYWWLGLLGLLLLGGVAVWQPWSNNTEETTTQSEPAKLSVRTTTAKRESIRAWASSEGEVQAVNYKHLAFEVEGDVTYIADRNGRRLREGDRVTRGELLAKVDDRELLADVSQARAAIAEARQNRAAAAAEVARAEAQVQQARSQVQQARSQVNKAQTGQNFARTELERYRLLVEQGAISESEFDSRISSVEDATADVSATQAEVAAAQGQVSSAQAQVRAAQEQYEATQSAITTAQARLSQAEVALEGTRLYAPFNGVVAYLNISEGEYYSPQIVSSQLGGDYQGILERIPMVIIDPSQYEVLVELAGSNGDRVEPGQTAFIASDNNIEQSVASLDRGNSAFNDRGSNNPQQDTLFNSARARGEVFAVNPAISPGGRAIEATVKLESETTEDIKHGEQVLTWIAVAEENNAVVVPLNAVVYRDRSDGMASLRVPYVFVVNPQGTIEQRQVELGIRGIVGQQILSGIEADESVVTQGQNRLVDGVEVKVVN